MCVNRIIAAIMLVIALAGSTTWAVNDAPRPHIAVPFAAIAPSVTADPNDPAWTKAATIPSMTPSLGSSSENDIALPTQVSLLWDAKYLYVRYVCSATEIYAPYKNHDDPLYKADAVEVFLDAKGDGRQWIEIELSPNNQTFEMMSMLTSDPVSNADLILSGAVLNREYWTNPTWDMSGLRTATRTLTTKGKVTGWIADFGLPANEVLHRLGKKDFGPLTMRANFLRYEYPSPPAGQQRSLQAQNWAPVSFGCPHLSPSAMGYVELVPHAVNSVAD